MHGDAKVGQVTLRGWKEIAAYMGRDVRTVQRWESRGLPVRRVPGSERGTVYALAADIDAWLLAPTTVVAEPAAATEPEPVAPAPLSLQSSAGRFSTRALIACGLLLCIAAAAAAKVSLSGRTLAVGSQPPAASATYASDAAYREAMHLFARRTPESLLAAEQQFRALVRVHPDDAPAWSGLAQTLTVVAAYGLLPTKLAQTESREAAHQALLLDPRLSEPHAVLGFSDYFWLGLPLEAEREFTHALQSSRRSSVSYSLYGAALIHQARFDEANTMLSAAQDLEPAAVHIKAAQALVLGLRGNRDKALQQLRALEGGDAAPIVEYDEEVLSLVTPRMPLAYLDRRIRLTRLARGSTQQLEAARAALMHDGEHAMWQSIALTSPGTLQHAEANAALNRTDQVFHDLAMMWVNDPCIGCGLAINPVFAAARNDARFKDYLQQQFVR